MRLLALAILEVVVLAWALADERRRPEPVDDWADLADLVVEPVVEPTVPARAFLSDADLW